MKKLIYRFSFLVALITFISNTLNGTTLLTSIMRSLTIFIIILLLSVITLKIVHWTLMLNQNEPKDEIIESENK